MLKSIADAEEMERECGQNRATETPVLKGLEAVTDAGRCCLPRV